MSHRFVRLMATALVVSGAACFASPKLASATSGFACDTDYCRSSPDCPSDEWLKAFCADKGCSSSSCDEDESTTGCAGAQISCSANRT